ncbi:MAG: hypothetical protein FWC32_09740 [Firmicutes bacterium]|nr:hypothetical protein [Bacillota bacterium]
MNKKLGLLLLLIAILALAAACGRGGADDRDREGRPFVEFSWYHSYDWFTPRVWGSDVISSHWGEKFNIHANTSAPDANAMEVLNLMVTADDLPDVIWMDRSPQMIEIANLGLLYSIDELIAFGYDNWYHENVPASAQAFYAEATGGINYVIPNWVRMGTPGVWGGATGGNQAWMYTLNVYNAVGAPTFRTFEDLYAYAVAVRDANLTNAEGAPIIPVLFNGGGGNHGAQFVGGIAASFGLTADTWFGWWAVKQDGTYGTVWDNTVWRAAVMEANRWHREGLFPATNMTNSNDQFLENFTAGRGGLIFHDHSGDNSDGFRRLLRESDPGNSIEVIYYMGPNRPHIFLPARGLAHEQIQHQVHGTLGWNTSLITRHASRNSNPGRIFELLTWMLSPLGSIEMMFGPQGHLWDELNAQGYPILHTSPEDLTGEQVEEIGLWRWDRHGHANNVDNAKFAANEMLPPESRNWVDYMQATIFTPTLRLSDEFQLMSPQIDSLSPLGIARQMMYDFMQEMLPQIILASSYEEAQRLFDQVRDFLYANGMAEIEEIYNARWHHNKALQGGSIFDLTNIPR